MINQGAASLPSKDAHTYKQLAKFYDQKNYRKGFKRTERLLETYPDHAETYALKALFELALGEENKALESAKLSVAKSKMRSCFCWHTFGSVYKQKKDFAQAAKCFQFALRFQPNEISIMRETANAQIQIRDHAAHVASRQAILLAKPNQIQHWIGFTLANHLRGDYPNLLKALNSLNNLVKTLEIKPIELSHYNLYRAVAFWDAEKYDLMYEDLKKNKTGIVDELIFNELLYKAALKLGKMQEAQDCVIYLLKKFPQNTEYLQNYREVSKLDDRSAYRNAKELFKSKIARIYELSFISEQKQFKQEFSLFIKPYFQKNLISLFAEMHIIYEAGKYAWIGDVLKEFSLCLASDAYPDKTPIESPSELVWSFYLLAQHYSMRFETLRHGLVEIEKAIKHTNTVTEFYLVKVDIIYKLHNNFQVIETVNEARKMDLADRYMNNICVNYLMKCEQPALGQEVVRIFMREESSIYELQNQWYIIETGKSLLKMRQFEAGLRHLKFIETQLFDMQCNEYDFHSYCTRKWTLREYTELIAFNDNLYDNKKYFAAAGPALKYFLEYIPHRANTKEEVKEVPKQTKNKHKVDPELTGVEAFHKRMDYSGKEYSESITKSPLDQALIWAKHVASAKYTNKHNVEENKLFANAYSYAIKVFILAKKPLLVLRCLKKLHQTQSSLYRQHLLLVEAVLFFEASLKEGKLHEIVVQNLKEFMSITLGDKTLKEYSEEVVEGWSTRIQEQYRYLLPIKRREVELLFTASDLRASLIQLYIEELHGIKDATQLQLAFYIAHKLEYYGELNSQMKEQLHSLFQNHTTYFSDWRNQVGKMSSFTWTMWWLSKYDIEREEKDEKEEEGKKKKEEEEGKKNEEGKKKQKDEGKEKEDEGKEKEEEEEK